MQIEYFTWSQSIGLLQRFSLGTLVFFSPENLTLLNTCQFELGTADKEPLHLALTDSYFLIYLISFLFLLFILHQLYAYHKPMQKIILYYVVRYTTTCMLSADTENWSQKTYLVPTHTDSSRVWVVQQSPVICHTRSPLRNRIIPQNMALINGVPSLPQGIA